MAVCSKTPFLGEGNSLYNWTTDGMKMVQLRGHSVAEFRYKGLTWRKERMVPVPNFSHEKGNRFRVRSYVCGEVFSESPTRSCKLGSNLSTLTQIG